MSESWDGAQSHPQKQPSSTNANSVNPNLAIDLVQIDREPVGAFASTAADQVIRHHRPVSGEEATGAGTGSPGALPGAIQTDSPPTLTVVTNGAVGVSGDQHPVENWAKHQWAADEASRGLGIELLAVRAGYSKMRMPVRPDMVRSTGSCHGGFVFAFADSAFLYACNNESERVVGTSADITWINPARQGDVLIAEAIQEVRFRQNGLTRVTITRASDGELIALVQGRSRAVGERPTRAR